MRTLLLIRVLLLAVMLGGIAACGGGGDDIDLGVLPVGGGDDDVDGDGGTPVTGDNLPPSAVIAVNQVVGSVPALTFNGSASTDSDGAITDYFWQFGDDEVGSGQVVSHVYSAPGIYIVSLTVTDNDGLTNTAQITVSVGTPLVANLAPGAAFTATPTSGAAPLAVAFDATLSSDADGFVTEYLWSFGDGTTGSGPLVSHSYTEPGIYDVRLTVVDNRSARSNATQTIVVAADTTGTGTGTGTGITVGAGDELGTGTGGEIGDDTGGDIGIVGGDTGTGGTIGGVFDDDTAVVTTSSVVGADARAMHRFPLQAGQAVELRYPVKNIASTDLDLFLFDVTDPQRPVYAGSSVGLADQERVVVPASREYVAVVEAAGSGSEYELAVTGARDVPPRPALTDEFQAGLLLVRGAELPADLAPVEWDADGTTVVRVAPASETGDPYWDGQEFLDQYLTVRRYKQLALDPQVPSAALVPVGTTDR